MRVHIHYGEKVCPKCRRTTEFESIDWSTVRCLHCKEVWEESELVGTSPGIGCLFLLVPVVGLIAGAIGAFS